jgi:hypothetical protein
VDVTLDDVELADSVLVTMESLGSQPNLTIQGATQVSTLVALNAATTTSFLVSGGQVILRFVGVQKRIDLQVRW